MDNSNYQAKNWGSEFGELFTNRYWQNFEEVDRGYNQAFGIPRSILNKELIGDLDRNIKILEVGSGAGLQLKGLQNLGFKHLYGIDIQRYAIEKSKQNNNHIDIIEGSLLDIPFKNDYFDMVYTSFVLIHIHPDNLSKALDEIYRCTKKYIWCAEYYSPTLQEVKYQGEDNMLWKQDFKELFLNKFSNLELVKEKKYHYLKEPLLQDRMFLLQKK